MSNSMTIFFHPEFGSLRAVLTDGNMWLSVQDVLSAVGYSGDGQDILGSGATMFELSELINTASVDPFSPEWSLKMVPQWDLYKLYGKGDLDKRKPVKEWIDSEVLLGYVDPPTFGPISDCAFLDAIATLMALQVGSISMGLDRIMSMLRTKIEYEKNLLKESGSVLGVGGYVGESEVIKNDIVLQRTDGEYEIKFCMARKRG